MNEKNTDLTKNNKIPIQKAEEKDSVTEITELLKEQIRLSNEIDVGVFKIFLVMVCMLIVNVIAATLVIVFSLI